MERPQLSDAVLLQMTEALIVNMGRRLEEKGRGAFVSNHEMLGVITEEYHELIEAIHRNDSIDVASELSDIAVACLVSLASLREADIQIKAAQSELEAELASIQGSEA